MLILDEDKTVFDCTVNFMFSEYIDSHDIKLKDVSHGTQVHISHLSKILNNRRQISESLRQRMNEFLGTDF